jgi:hypothetical protein
MNQQVLFNLDTKIYRATESCAVFISPFLIWYTLSMQEVLHANIFFFITAVGVVIITILMAVALVYGIKLVKNLSEISEEVKGEAHEYVDASRTFREKMATLPFISWFAGKKHSRRSKRDK